MVRHGSLNRHLTAIDALIRALRWTDAQVALEAITLADLSRAEKLTFAQLAVRCRQPLLGLRALQPYVRPGAKSLETATGEERLEYARLLLQAGGLQESYELLSVLVREKQPGAGLYLAFLHVYRWDYALAIPCFEQCLFEPSRDPYDRTVLQLNLAASYLHQGEWDKARDLLRVVEQKAASADWVRLRVNAEELLARIDLHHRRWDDAIQRLATAEQREVDGPSFDLFSVRKWKRYALFQKAPHSAEGQRLLEEVRAMALEQPHRETLRECDLLEAITLRKGALAQKVFHGTPLPAFRDRLRRAMGPRWSPAPEYAWPLLDRRRGASPEIRWDAPALALPLALQKILGRLSSDIYRGQTLVELFHAAHPEQHFDAESSPPRVHQLVQRSREALRQRRLPLEVKDSGRVFYLEATAPITLVLGRLPTPLERLRASMGGRSFTASEAAQQLRMSVRGVLSLLDDAVAEGTMTVAGASNPRRYAFTHPAAKVA